MPLRDSATINIIMQRHSRHKADEVDIWTEKMLAKKLFRLARVAMPNKSARIIWEILTKREEFRQAVV